MNALALIPVILLLDASYFDMQGTIMNVISPSSLLIGSETAAAHPAAELRGIQNNNTVNLADVDASGLNLTGSYNSVSINEMIQKEISDLKEMRRFFCDGFCDYS